MDGDFMDYYDASIKLVNEFIELINDKEFDVNNLDNYEFKNGESIKYFWINYNIQVRNELVTNPKYFKGYDTAYKNVSALSVKLKFVSQINEIIELINSGYDLYKDPKKVKFGLSLKPMKSFLKANKEEIVEHLYHNPAFEEGYDTALIRFIRPDMSVTPAFEMDYIDNSPYGIFKRFDSDLDIYPLVNGAEYKGYRFVIRKADVSEKVVQGGNLDIQLKNVIIVR